MPPELSISSRELLPHRGVCRHPSALSQTLLQPRFHSDKHKNSHHGSIWTRNHISTEDHQVFIRTWADMTNQITRKAARARARSFCWPIRDRDRLMVSSKYVRLTIVRNSYAAALAQCKPPHWIFIAVMESHTEHVVSYAFLHPGNWTEGISTLMPSLNANFHHNKKLKWNNGSQWSPSLTVKWFNGTKQWFFMLK